MIGKCGHVINSTEDIVFIVSDGNGVVLPYCRGCANKYKKEHDACEIKLERSGQ